MTPFQPRRTLAATLLGTSLLTAPVLAYAQTVPPDAGQVLRDTQRPATPQAPQNLPTLTVPDEADASADPGQKLTVTTVRITGNVSIASGTLMPLVTDIQGKEVTLGDLRATARRITAYYRGHGYTVARAFIPAQKVSGGVVDIQVLEGNMAGGSVVNHSAVGQATLDGILAAQKLNGKVITSARTDRALLLLADLPAVGKVAGKLKPGADVGTSDLVITADAGKRVDGTVSVDTYGNRYTGQTRVNGAVNVNSPTGHGDRLSAQASLTDENLLYGRAAYDLPLGGNGLRAGVSLSNSAYELGRDFASLAAHGEARSGTVYALYPLVRSLNRNVWLTASVEDRKLTDHIDSVLSVTHKQASVTTVGAYGDVQDALFGGGYSTWNVSYVSGKLSIKSPAALATDVAGPRTNGSYSKITVSLSRLQAVSAKTSLSLGLSGQLAGHNLDSSEKFVIGGIYGVRAYPQGEGAGDSGWLANAELRHSVARNVQVSAFYDAGRVEFNKTPYAPGDKGQSLNSIGVSAAAQRGNLNARVTVAWRAGTAAATTAPDRSPRIWASVGYAF